CRSVRSGAAQTVGFLMRGSSLSPARGRQEPAEGALMVANSVLEQFSRNRLDGEPAPGDLGILLPHRDELAERTSIRLEWAEDWAPWKDANFLSDAEPLGPDATPNVRAIKEVSRHIAFIGADQAGQLFGYWRGPSHRTVEESPLVILDDKG